MDKLFIIQPDYHYWIFTGVNADGLPMFAAKGIHYEFVIVYFAADGTFLRFEEHERMVLEYEITISPLETDARKEDALNAYLLKMGFAKIQPIRVKKFFIPEHLIGIRQYPDSLQRFLKNGHEYSPEEMKVLASFGNGFSKNDLTGYSEQDDIDDADYFERWTESGDYVMWCQNDYWSNAQGFIHSS